MSDRSDLSERVMRNLWPSFKRRLLQKFPSEDWIRPMYLLKVLRGNEKQVHLLAALPPNGGIIAGALNRLAVMREMLSPSFNLSLTTYPDDWQIQQARERYGIDIAPKPWARRST